MSRIHVLLTIAGGCAALGAGLPGATATAQEPVANIEWPRPQDLVSGTMEVRVQVEALGGSWRLTDRHDGLAPVEIAAGEGDLAPGTTVFQGQLANGMHALELEILCTQGPVSQVVNLVATNAQVPGWPFQEGLSGISSGLNLMAECAGGEVVLTRQGTVQRHAPDPGELVWLNGLGRPLPGWPVQLADLSQALSLRMEPLLVRRGEEEHLLAASKTHLLEFSRDGQLHAQAALLGYPVGEPVFMPVPQNGSHALVYVMQQDVTNLLEYDASLQHVSGMPLPGVPAWSRPVLGDLSGDGRTDVILIMRLADVLQVLLLDGQSGALDLIHSQPALDLSSVHAGDLDGDLITDLVLVGCNGTVLALDRNGLHWSRSLPGCTLGAASLVDLEGDGRQEVAVLGAQVPDGVLLFTLDADGQQTPLSGTLVSAGGSAVHAPQLVRDGGNGRRLLLTINPQGADWATRFLVMDLQGHVSDPGWLLPGAPSGPPRVADLDADGTLELVAGDGFGRWAAWPTGWNDACPPHPLGDKRHGALALQPIHPLAAPALLYGAMSLPPGSQLAEGLEVEEFALVSGDLRVDAPFAPRGGLWIGPGAALTLDQRSSWAVDAPVRVVVEGSLTLRDGGGSVARVPRVGYATASNNLLAGMQLVARPGSHLRLQDCLIHQLPAPLTLSACSLSMVDSWMLAGSQGLILHDMAVDARSCLFQPGAQGLQFLDGSRGRLDECLITSGTGTAILNRGSQLEMRNSQILTCQDAVLSVDSAVTVLDSVHFQGNRRDLILAANHGGVELRNCDFVESHVVGVLNQAAHHVTATACHWDLMEPCQGPVQREGDRPSPVLPLVIPCPVFAVKTGPMVDGDEPMEWDPVEFSVGDIPIRVVYHIYRGSQPYDVLRPENLVAITPLTNWRDPEHHHKVFYCVTASIGKQVVR